MSDSFPYSFPIVFDESVHDDVNDDCDHDVIVEDGIIKSIKIKIYNVTIFFKKNHKFIIEKTDNQITLKQL